jgi:hypothetical protein
MLESVKKRIPCSTVTKSLKKYPRILISILRMSRLSTVTRELALVRSTLSQLFDRVHSLIRKVEAIQKDEEESDSSDSDYRSLCPSPSLTRQETLGNQQLSSPINLTSEYEEDEEFDKPPSSPPKLIPTSGKVYKKSEPQGARALGFVPSAFPQRGQGSITIGNREGFGTWRLEREIEAAVEAALLDSHPMQDVLCDCHPPLVTVSGFPRPTKAPTVNKLSLCTKCHKSKYTLVYT